MQSQPPLPVSEKLQTDAAYGVDASESWRIKQIENKFPRRVVDVNVLKSLIGSDATLVRRFLHDFRCSTNKIATELIIACTAGQVGETTAQAHKLKSSCHSVGALTLGQLCAALEHAGRESDGIAQARLLPEFERELAIVEEFLDKY